MEHVVVVGSSLAGLRACETLRTEGFTGTVTMVGSEPHLPYDRPPLSKKYLAGEWGVEQIALRRPESLGELNLTLKLGSAAVSLDTASQRLHLADGTAIGYDGLVIATGANCRKLPGQPELAGIHELRTLDDANALHADLARRSTPARVVVIGAGFIGLEVAATAREPFGCEVTVLEGLPAPLVRGLGAEMGNAVALVHADHGVAVRCGVQVSALEGDGSKVTGVRLASGEVVPADIVVVGIGVVPATEWLTDGRIEVRDGVVCDATLRTAVPGVYAAGDIARWHNNLYDEEMRVEHWTTAADQGAAAATNLLAVSRGEEPKPFEAVPFFWSDQFEARVQFLGRAAGDDEVRVVHGSVEERKFVALYGSKGRFRGALGVTLPKKLMPYRKLLQERASWEAALAFAAEKGN